jgi:NADH-quinone oxidoreductase subunit K
MMIFILTMAAAEVAVGLALILSIFRRHKLLNADEISQLNG